MAGSKAATISFSESVISKISMAQFNLKSNLFGLQKGTLQDRTYYSSDGQGEPDSGHEGESQDCPSGRVKHPPPKMAK